MVTALRSRPRSNFPTSLADLLLEAQVLGAILSCDSSEFPIDTASQIHHLHCGLDRR